jgi:uncharacterized protein (TIGR02266 family)
MSEKRQHLRMPVSLKVAYRTRDALQKDLVTDLSPGGLFVRTSKPLPIGTEVELEVSIAEEEPPIRVRGRVVWLRGEKEGMGIQFTGLMGPVLAELVGGEK